MSTFVHLRNHTKYSLLEGSTPVKKLVSRTRDFGSGAVGITDTNVLYGALEFASVAAENGIKPIVGMQTSVRGDGAYGDVVLYAMSETGYENLMSLTQKIYMRDSAERYVTLDELYEASEDVICLTGGPEGLIGKMILKGDEQDAFALLSGMKDVFADRLYVEIQRHPDEKGILPDVESGSEAQLIDFAYELDLPLVATNDSRFMEKADYDANDALLAIGEKTSIDFDASRTRYTPQHGHRPPEEMEAVFEDLPEAIENTVEIAKRCSYIVPKRAPILPMFAADEGTEIRRQSHEGLTKRLEEIEAVADEKTYRERLDFELDIIEKMGFPGYFLIVSDFIQWAKDNDIPVGPGRGSGAGSLVAYALKITDLDPLRYGLLFERFLNPERVSMPDFDIDFCMDRREEVIDYVRDKYGESRVGQIITFGGLLSKMAVKDAGRALGVGYNKTQAISDMIPKKGVAPVSISEALEMEPRLSKMVAEEPEIARLMKIAEGIEGSYRSAGTHAAGVVIADRPLEQLVPVYRDPKSNMPATQFNMKWVEQAGLVKFDFLGLKTLTVIKRAEQMIEKATGKKLDVSKIPVDDPQTYDLLRKAETVAVFQVESAGMMDALRRMQPDRIEDIVALVALYRPGPMSNIPTYCDVKNGRENITSIHPLIDEILEETQGIIVYQEQVMEVARKMAGYTLGGADLLRRAMGKKIAAEMAKERPKFIEGSVKNGVPEQKAGEVFDLLEKFADYGFNKSHAAAYAVISYQTAWLKANHPVPFMAAVMSCDADDTKKLSIFQREADRMGIKVSPPNVNRSDVDFLAGDNEIIYALSAVKGIGEKAVAPIVEERKRGGPFRDLADFASRINLKAVGARPLASLIHAGALDDLHGNRAELFENLGALVSWSTKKHEMTSGATMDLFADAFDLPKLRKVADYKSQDRMLKEHEAIGFYLTGHPLDEALPALRRVGVRGFAEIAEDLSLDGEHVTLCGTITDKEEKNGKKGSKYAFIHASDPTGSYEMMAFGRSLDQFRDLLEPGKSVVIQARCEFKDDQLRMSLSNVMSADDAIPKTKANGILVRVSSDSVLGEIRSVLRTPSANEASGTGTIRALVQLPDGSESVTLLSANADFGFEARSAISKIPGVMSIMETGAETRIQTKKASTPQHLIGNKGVRGADRSPTDTVSELEGVVVKSAAVTSVRKVIRSESVELLEAAEVPVYEMEIPF